MFNPLILLVPCAVMFCFGQINTGNGAEQLVSSRSLHQVTLDGQITSPDEWSDTSSYDVSLDKACCWPDKQVDPNAAVMTVRFKNDDSWLYMLYKIRWPESETDPEDGAFIENFIGPYGPPWAESDFSAVSFGGETVDLHGWDDTRWYSDVEAGGRNDVEGAASYKGDSYWFEFRKRLSSGDGYDWTLEAAGMVGLMVGLFDDGDSVAYEQSVLLHIAR